jgi:hypothetical protein
MNAPATGCRPVDFNDEYRSTVCKIGQGSECCRYLTCGAQGFNCEKHTSLAWTIDGRVDQMTAKGDNCGGVYEPQPAFRLLKPRFEHPAGSIIYRAKGYDYGLSSDDARMTGKPHTSMTLEPSGNYPSFTVPDEDFAPLVVEEAQS